jgi:hypothetical protein
MNSQLGARRHVPQGEASAWYMWMHSEEEGNGNRTTRESMSPGCVWVGLSVWSF